MNRLFSLLAGLTGLYSTLIVIRILFSWVMRGRSINDNKVTMYLAKITDPYLNIFRGIKFTRAGMLDFSPMAALLVLNIIQSVFIVLSQFGTITIPVIVVIVIRSLWEYLFKYILLFIVILLGIRVFLSYSKSNAGYSWIPRIDSIVNAPVGFVWKLFYRNKTIDNKKLALTSFIFYCASYILIKYLLRYVISWLYTV